MRLHEESSCFCVIFGEHSHRLILGFWALNGQIVDISLVQDATYQLCLWSGL